MKRVLQLLAIGLTLKSGAFALPMLQLDVSPGVYVADTESTLATTNSFELYALINSLTPSGTFYISAAVLPQQSNVHADLGSFVFNGQTINATADMTWGSPANMPPHGVFPTWYKEFAFDFSTALRTTNYNVEDVGGVHAGPTENALGNALYMAFSVDVSNLADGAMLVFDLYSYQVVTDGKKTKVKFIKAPFSHNAEAYPRTVQVPDGGATAMLLGLGLFTATVGRWHLRRRR